MQQTMQIICNLSLSLTLCIILRAFVVMIYYLCHNTHIFTPSLDIHTTKAYCAQIQTHTHTNKKPRARYECALYAPNTTHHITTHTHHTSKTSTRHFFQAFLFDSSFCSPFYPCYMHVCIYDVPTPLGKTGVISAILVSLIDNAAA